jgi:hypothetical protein
VADGPTGWRAPPTGSLQRSPRAVAVRTLLGEGVNWVRNVRAAGGEAVLRHGRREEVRLEEVAPEQRAPVLKAYLERAPNARTHVPVDKDAPLEEFERVAPRLPVFRVVPRDTFRRRP